MDRSLRFSANDIIERLRGATVGLLLALFTVPFPLIGILQGYSPTTAPWQESAFIALAVLSGVAIGWSYKLKVPEVRPPQRTEAPKNETLLIKTADGAELLISERIEPIVLPDLKANESSKTSNKVSVTHLSIGSNKLFNRLTKLILPAMPYCRCLFLMLFFAAVALSQRLHMCLIANNEPLNWLCRTSGICIAVISVALLVSFRSIGNVTRLKPITNMRLAILLAFASAPLAFGVWLNLCALPGILVMMRWGERTYAK